MFYGRMSSFYTRKSVRQTTVRDYQSFFILNQECQTGQKFVLHTVNEPSIYCLHLNFPSLVNIS